MNGFVFEGKPSDEFVMRVHHLGNGHKEAIIQRQYVWEEVGPVPLIPPEILDEVLAMREREAEERREANRERAARRAKTNVRRRIKAMGLDSMLTLTYRENQQDLGLVKRHMKEFVRRMRRVLGTREQPGVFSYVAAFERQSRGAWHVHMAVHRLPKNLPWGSGVKVKSWNVVRAIWRSVVGELGGNIDESRRKSWTKRSSGKIAGYISKYMVKAFAEGDDWSNRYSASSIELPKPIVVRFKAYALAELVALAYDEVAGGPVECMTWLDGFGDVFFLSTEGPPGAANGEQLRLQA
ncbi:MAG: hypothetical protein J7598_13630 [Mitsuaria chitosanitabida]|uniref:rolling circle replication-associated protein n=1 Tax=Roseateles chitosanitabidus TaxID=65048 RepID=UPI001B001AB2|nr:hypothetical protein [Roseateles chitosanitabidus]MBO9687641.1 hypothetical protein [Roseateles chitosanitabidus]